MTSGLSEKDLRILKAVINLYIMEGQPVSSLNVKKSTGSPVSTATIRNALARLESCGYLAKPHTSAGRVPTDEGYRFMVDTLSPNQELCNRFTDQFRSEIGERFEIERIMETASRMLGDISKNFAVVYGSVVQESKVNKLSLVELEGNRVMAVLRLIPDHEHTATIRMPRRFSAEILNGAEKMINSIIIDKSLVEAQEALKNSVRDNVTDEGIIVREIAVNRELIFSEPPAINMYFEDREHLLQQPELSDPDLLKLLLRLLHNKEYLTSILSERLVEKTTVTIGGENDDKYLKYFSLVTAGYKMGASRGVLGVLGPTRMRYDLTLLLVGSLARELIIIGEEHF